MENQFNSPKPPERCESSLQSSSLPSWYGRLLSPVRKSLWSVLARVNRAIHAILLAETTNLRYYLAALLIAGLAPFSEVACKLFDPHEGTGYWNTYYFLYSIGPHVSGLLVMSGCFLLFKKKDQTRYLVVIPAAYKIAKILWLSQVSSNEGIHAFTPFGFLLVGLVGSVVWFSIFHYLMSLHFHKKMGSIARMIGLIGSPGLDDTTARRMAQDEIKIYHSLN